MDYKWSEIISQKMNTYRKSMFEAERYILEHPQTGFKEWDAHNYLKSVFVGMGFKLREAGNIPGFSFDIDTQKEGPTIAIVGELDALVIPIDAEFGGGTSVMHACGHHCQVSALIGVAGVLSDNDVLSKLCGKIRIVAVPAEELTELSERAQMRKDGKIKYLSGKSEFMSRGFFDGVDFALMVHTGLGDKPGLSISPGCSGIVAKRVIYHGSKNVSGSSPKYGVNALYAAQTAMSSINALREIFPHNQFARCHSIITKGGHTVQHIPSEVIIESNVRAYDYDVLKVINQKINRAYVAGAVAFGAQVTIEDLEMYIPRNIIDKPKLVNFAYEAGCDVFGRDNVIVNLSKDATNSGGTDFGNLGAVVPSISLHCTGAAGGFHTHTFAIKDTECAVFYPAVLQATMACAFLENEAIKAKEVISEYKPIFSSMREYFEEMDKFYSVKDSIDYTKDGGAILNW